MKKLIPILLLLFVFTSGCKKNEVEPDWSNVVEGDYPITYLATNGWSLTLPKSGATGNVVLRRISPSLITMRIFLANNGQTVVDQSTNAYLTGQGQIVDFYSDDKRQSKAGSATKNDLDITLVNPDGMKITVRAKR